MLTVNEGVSHMPSLTLAREQPASGVSVQDCTGPGGVPRCGAPDGPRGGSGAPEVAVGGTVLPPAA